MKKLSAGSLILLAMCLGLSARADTEPTAFELVKTGDQYVGVQSKDRVVQIRSEKSVGSLVPNIWYVVYYDPTTTLKTVEVKFGGGKMMDVSRPLRLLEPMTGGNRVLDSDKLKIDSDKAFEVVLKEPLLKSMDLRATQFWLEHGDLGPQWRIRLFAARFSDRSRMADIGDVFVSCATGEVLRNDLHPNSAE